MIDYYSPESINDRPKRKPGRPLGSPNRASGALLKPLTIRLTATEHAALEAIKARTGLTLAAACRWCIAKQVDAQRAEASDERR